ncbi:MAG: cytidine deaminase [Candidatus Gastranaerophilales bacterium]|nr:cytidine deaminase [Candidatus Gastranaerophilales bacterium]
MKTNEELLELAKNVSGKAYCPYSNFKVGACTLFESGNVYTGCNIENSSYGLSLCAERNAISSAIAAGETGRLIKIAIYSPNSSKCFPCGACRQWIKEFSTGYNTEIILENDKSEISSYYIDDILPFAFNMSR